MHNPINRGPCTSFKEHRVLPLNRDVPEPDRTGSHALDRRYGSIQETHPFADRNREPHTIKNRRTGPDREPASPRLKYFGGPGTGHKLELGNRNGLELAARW